MLHRYTAQHGHRTQTFPYRGHDPADDSCRPDLRLQRDGSDRSAQRNGLSSDAPPGTRRTYPLEVGEAIDRRCRAAAFTEVLQIDSLRGNDPGGDAEALPTPAKNDL